VHTRRHEGTRHVTAEQLVEPGRSLGPLFVDLFEEDVPSGRVIGSAVRDGVLRRGVDAEGVIGVDHGALRIRPLVDNGWGRALLAYGPYDRRAGLTMATLALNGHNTSQSERLPEKFRKRLAQWLKGHSAERSTMRRRAREWLLHPRKRYMIRRSRIWLRMSRGPVVELDENLAVGWFADEVQREPGRGNGLVMHAALGENGELWARIDDTFVPVVRGLQNVPICFVVVVRDRGAAYYIGSIPGAAGTAALPELRPIGVDTSAQDPTLHACIHQAVLGQIGFRVDTRVSAVEVAHVPALADWCGSAHAADRLSGSGALHGSDAERGGPWTVGRGEIVRDTAGCHGGSGPSVAVVDPGRASGLVHVELTGEGGGIRWRHVDMDHALSLVVADGAVRLVLTEDGVDRDVATDVLPPGGAPRSAQVIDDGAAVTVVVDGRRCFGGPLSIDAYADATAVGILVGGAGSGLVRRFEAHPRSVSIDALETLPTPWFAVGTEVVVHDDFGGPAGVDLHERTTTTGGAAWNRSYGDGHIRTTGESAARVDATVSSPNPGNTAYTVPWDSDALADVEVEITPPGRGRGEGECSRAGIIIWDDEQNFLTISLYLDDSYEGASVAIFSHLDGFEELFDAVWTMVGDRVDWGVPHRLRVVSDGLHLLVFIDDEPVLYRAITDIYRDRPAMTVNRVGLVVNWEWGDDTGSTFREFTVRTVPS
jgi:hypothetical protein